MHVLHKVLARLDELGIELSEDKPKEEQLLEVRKEVLSTLDEYAAGVAYDWREDTAGRWANIYPNNVILGKYDSQNLISEIKNAKAYQDETVMDAIKIIDGNNSVSLMDFWKMIQNSSFSSPRTEDGKTSEEKSKIYVSACYLRDYIGGKFTWNIPFIDPIRDDVVITDSTIKEIIDSPENFALVFVDCHY